VAAVLLNKEAKPTIVQRIYDLFHGGRDSATVRGVPYEPTAPYGVCRAKFESVEVLWRVVCDRGGVVMEC
jgi:hypothetical protein